MLLHSDLIYTLLVIFFASSPAFKSWGETRNPLRPPRQGQSALGETALAEWRGEQLSMTCLLKPVFAPKYFERVPT
jgi:hypothetical protein